MSISPEQQAENVSSGDEELDDNPVIPEALPTDTSSDPQDPANVRTGETSWVFSDPVTGLVSNPVIPHGGNPEEVETASVELKSAGYLEVVSTPEELAEAIAFFDREKAKESEGQKGRAKSRSTVFYIMQYRRHKDTGEVMLTQEQLSDLYAALEAEGLLEKRADIWHDADRFDETEAAEQRSNGYSVRAGDLKPLHCHAVLKLKRGCEKSIRYISDRARIPSARIRVPREVAESEGRKAQIGPTAAVRAFFDGAQYLTHEGGKHKAKNPYSRDQVDANFDFGLELDAHFAGRAPGGKSSGSGSGSGSGSKLTELDVLVMRVQELGLTLHQAKIEDPLSFSRGKSRLVEARSTYLQYAAMPLKRDNYYFGGPSGSGKSVTAMMFALVLASILYPQLAAEEAIFVVGRKGVEFQKYDGQPILLWDDFRPLSLINAFGGDREALWPALDISPKPIDVNRKYGSIRLVNAVNIITGIQPHLAFLHGLAGDYKDRDGVPHLAEDPKQAFRRFGWVNEVTEESISFYFDLGFAGTGEYGKYEHYATAKANMRQVSETLASIKDPVELEKARLDNGQRMLSVMIDARLRLQPPATLTGAQATVQLEAMTTVLTGDAMKQFEDDRAIAAIAAAEATKAKLARQWDGPMKAAPAFQG